MKKLMILMCVCVLISCCTKYVTVPEYHVMYQTKTDSVIRRDSVLVRDSVLMFLRGDTVYKEKYQILYKDRWNDRYHTDTIIRRDSIRVPYPVERQLSKWDTWRMRLGNCAVVVIITVVMCMAVYYIKGK